MRWGRRCYRLDLWRPGAQWLTWEAHVTDGDVFVIARGDKALRPPAPWRPLVVHGRWLSDAWGSAWLQVDRGSRELASVFDRP